jgi:2-keto-4-pentenoate hydratase
MWSDARVVAGMRRQLDARDALVADGARPIGWKAGLGTRAAMAAMEIDGPVAGFLTDRSPAPHGGEVEIGGWESPALEPEIAARLGADLPGGADRAAAAAAIDAIAPAIELVDSSGPRDLESVLAGDIFHRRIVLGDFDTARAGLRLDGITVDVEGREERYASGVEPTELLGDLLDVVRHLADGLAALGEGMRAGDIVMTGSVIAPVAVQPGERIECRFAGLGSVAVSFR